jgi:hypothetical protein
MLRTALVAIALLAAVPAVAQQKNAQAKPDAAFQKFVAELGPDA